MKNNFKNNNTNENKEFIKNLEIGFIVLAIVLFVLGVGIIIYGNATLTEYYVEPINANYFFKSIKEFLTITIKYSTAFYVGFLIVLLSVVCLILSIITFVYDYEYYTEKTKELDDVLKVINPNNKKVKTVEVGAKYIDTNLNDKKNHK